MRNTIISLAVAALAVTSASAQPRRVVFPGSLDASALALPALNGGVLSRSGAVPVQCIVEFADGADIDAMAGLYGLHVNTVAGNLATVIVPSDRIVELSGDRDVIRVSAGSEVRTMADEAARMSGVDLAHAGAAPLASPYKGEGVIIGVIDSGFDFLHPAFVDADGHCRIATVWDQNRTVSQVGSVPDFGYGIVLDNEADIRSVAHDMSGDTHGTHVAAIAASSADVYGGMAPKAELALVSTNKSEAGMADGLKFLLDYADAVGKPLAVNISMGTVIGFKDGSDPLALMLDRLMDGRSGQIIAVAAGNEGHRRSTIVTGLDGSSKLNTRLVPPSYNRENLFVGASAGQFTLTLSLHDASGAELFSMDAASDATESARYDNLTGDNDGSFVAVSAARNSESAAVSVSVNLYCPLTDGRYWEASVDGSAARYIMTADYGELTDGSNASTIACTACGYHTIAVGAYVSRSSFVNLAGAERNNGWTIGDEYIKSGKGPTFDGRAKPEIMAPGASVISAINSYASAFSVNRDDLALSRPSAVVSGRTDYWGSMDGTSMATPVVTGILALWLEADPGLTRDRAVELMAGMDKIDAVKGLTTLAAGIDGVEVDMATEIDVYDLHGRHMRRAAAGSCTDGLAPGIYLIRSGSECRKVVVR